MTKVLFWSFWTVCILGYLIVTSILDKRKRLERRNAHRAEIGLPPADDFNETTYVSKPCDNEHVSKIRTVVIRGNEYEVFFTSVSGASHLCDHGDVGGFEGYEKAEPTNDLYWNAFAIYRNDGKKIGYIPMQDSDEYLDFSDDKERQCVGFINESKLGVYGYVNVLPKSDYAAKIETIKFVRWLIEENGVDFIPHWFRIDTNANPVTKAEWIQSIDEYLNKELS